MAHNVATLIFFLILSKIVTARLSHIDSSAYDHQLAGNKLSLVFFTANGCSACDKVYDVLSEAQHDIPDFPIGVVSCFEEPKICDQAKVFALPRLMLAVGEDELVQYSEGFDKESIVRFVQRQSGPAVTSINDLNDKEYTVPTSISVVAFIAANDQQSNAVYARLAHKWRRHFSFELAGDADLAEQAQVTQPGVVIYKPFDDMRCTHDTDFGEQELERFLSTATLPLVSSMNPIVYDRHVENGLPLGQIVCPADKCSQLIAAIYPLADRLRSKMGFMLVNSDDFPARGGKLGLGQDSLHGFAIEEVQTTRVYPMLDRELSSRNIETFVTNFLKGSLIPHIKSEKPVKREDGALMTLVGSNFETVALDPSLDVLALFEVPWCDYCQELYPVLQALGQQYIDRGVDDKFAVVKVDVSSNDVPTRIEEYPTIRLWRAGDNAVRSFNGTYFSLLTTEELAAFVRAGGGHTLALANQADAKDEL